MHRLLVEGELLNSDRPELSKEANRHLRVLRPEVGEPIELFDGKGSWRTYSWQVLPGTKDGFLEAASPIESQDRPQMARITLFACVTKGSRWDWTLEKATELGVDRIVPVISERTIVRISAEEREAKRERWLRIVEDAVRQSNAKWIPELLPPMEFAKSLELVEETHCLIGALTDPPSPPIATAIENLPILPENAGWATYVGPEGDFTPDELKALVQRAQPVSFGASILRAETAAIFSLSLLVAKRGKK